MAIVTRRMAAAGIVCGLLGIGAGTLEINDQDIGRADAKQCLVELGSLATSNGPACVHLKLNYYPADAALPSAAEIKRDHITGPRPSNQQIYSQAAGIGIFTGLVGGFFIGLGAVDKKRDYSRG